jgi:two-component system KDP operon response regulator KdpE
VLLEGHGYRVLSARTAREGTTLLATHNPDVVILDLGLPDGDGIAVTRSVREWTSTPIIVVSARGNERDKVEALDVGADDYLTKPFGSHELLARLRVALRHSERVHRTHESASIEIGDLVVDIVGHQVSKRGVPVPLTRLEFKLLALLARHAGRLLTHEQILREVWGAAHVGNTHYVRVYMAQLRRKVEDDPARPTYLLTEVGVGYRMCEAPRPGP